MPTPLHSIRQLSLFATALLCVATTIPGCANEQAISEQTVKPQATTPITSANQALPPKPTAIADNEPEVTRSVREIIEHIATGTLPAELLDGRLQSLWFPDLIKTMQAELVAVGKLNKIELLQREVDGEHRIYHYRLVLQNQTCVLMVRFGKGSKVVRWERTPE